jgi:hypothetical protein
MRSSNFLHRAEIAVEPMAEDRAGLEEPEARVCLWQSCRQPFERQGQDLLPALLALQAAE